MDLQSRERDFEARYAHDQELRFRIEARRNKLLGLWAAGLMGMADAEADAYAQEVIKADFLLPGDDDVFQKLRDDLHNAGIEQSEHQIRRHMAECLATAENQIRND